MIRRIPFAHRYIYLWVKQRKVNRFVANAARCRDVQHNVLFTKLRRNAPSEFGRKHGFSEIRSVADFRQRVPVADYEYYRPYVERVKLGKIDTMFGPGTRVLMLSMTSGTTSQSKYIPITDHFFAEYRKAWNIWGLGVFRDHVDLLLKYALHFGSDWQQSTTEAGIACGNISGLVAETRPRISNPIFFMPPEINKISGTTHKQYAALRLALPTSKVGLLGTANPLTLLNLARLADARSESLIRDLYDGKISEPWEVPPSARPALDRRFRLRHAQRARELERIVERTGHLHPRDFWPNLSVVSVWMGSSMGIYLPKVREYYGDVAMRDHGLSASEGHMTTPLQDETPAGVLDYPTHFFEFIPEAEHGSERATALEAHELEVGQQYYILLTTSSGLYRYDIHDVVRCVEFEGTCPVLEFLHKGAHFSSMVGEKLSEFQVAQAVPKALEDRGLAIEQFALAPIPGDPGYYVLLIEEDLDHDAALQLAQRADARLAEFNCEYEDRLASKRLGPLAVRHVPEGTWTAIRKERISQQGGSMEQYKHPFLASRSGLADRLIKLAGGPSANPAG